MAVWARSGSVDAPCEPARDDEGASGGRSLAAVVLLALTLTAMAAPPAGAVVALLGWIR